MYNRLRIRIDEECKTSYNSNKENSFKEAEDCFIKDFKFKYAKFANKDEYFYFTDKKIDFEEIFADLLKFEKYYYIAMYMDTIYEKEDFDKADAFLMNFPKYCYYYDEPEDEQYNSMQVLYKGKENLYREHIEKMYIMPNGLKSKFAKECMGASTDMGTHVISQSMKEYLLENGIDDEYIRPVYQKNGQSWADYLYGENHMLPSLSLLGYSDDRLEFYQKYNVIEIDHEKIRGDSLWNDFKKALTIGDYPGMDKWEIRADVLDNLGDVNITTDFYGCERYTVISKRLFELIRRQVPKITKVSQPIFAADFTVEIGEKGEIIKRYK